MSNSNITENNEKNKEKEAKIFYGRFWQYDFTNEHQKLCFINIIDKRGDLIKEKFCFNIHKLDHGWIADLIQDAQYKLAADMVVDKKYEGRIDLQNVRVLSEVKTKKLDYKKRKKFYAVFERYEFDEYNHRFYFTQIKDENKNLIKTGLCYNVPKEQYSILGDIRIGTEYELSAQLIMDSRRPNGCSLANPRIETDEKGNPIKSTKHINDESDNDDKIGGSHNDNKIGSSHE